MYLFIHTVYLTTTFFFWVPIILGKQDKNLCYQRFLKIKKSMIATYGYKYYSSAWLFYHFALAPSNICHVKNQNKYFIDGWVDE